MALTYEEAGVSIDAGNLLVERIKPLARATRTPLVLDGVGGFAGLCRLPEGLEDPVLVSGTDGVGTKLKIAQAMNRHDTVGIDLVAMCVNDVLTTGALPLFFLDYFSCGKLVPDIATAVITGIAEGCKRAGCALLGGETAEHPGGHEDGEYDLAGFAVGVASRNRLLGPDRVRAGDVLLGIRSSGVHSNGFSLVRTIVERRGLGYDDPVDSLGGKLGDALLTPTRIYAESMRALQETLGEGLHAACHVTGGGITENLPRILPQGVRALVDCPAPPPIFEWIAEQGPVDLAEMRKTFNMGVGLIVVVEHDAADTARAALKEIGEAVIELGSVAPDQSAANPSVQYI